MPCSSKMAATVVALLVLSVARAIDAAAAAPGGIPASGDRNAGGDRGVVVRYNTKQMPCFSQWKNTASTGDGYVTGLEPGTDHPNSKTFERDQGRLLSLAPEALHVIEMTIEVHDDVAGVQAVQQEIASIQGDSPVEVHDQPLSHLSG